jgi:hypothetical protein
VDERDDHRRTIDARNRVGKPAVYGDFFLEIDRIRVY